MVAKRTGINGTFESGLNLAKIHMVAKLLSLHKNRKASLNLAKIHMVAKLLKTMGYHKIES